MHQTVYIDEKIVWDRKADGGFPEIKVLKQRVRDIVSPERDLGHADSNTDDGKQQDQEVVDVGDDMDERDAADMRNFYGVL